MSFFWWIATPDPLICQSLVSTCRQGNLRQDILANICCHHPSLNICITKVHTPNLCDVINECSPTWCSPTGSSMMITWLDLEAFMVTNSQLLKDPPTFTTWGLEPCKKCYKISDTGYASPPDKPKIEMTVECARPGNSLAQVWQEWAVKVTLFRLIRNE